MSEASKEVYYPASSRIGKFNILSETLNDGSQRPWLQALFGLCVVIDVEDHESGRGKTYIASSEMFQPLMQGEEIPEYRIEQIYDMPFANPEWEARRINNGKFGMVAIRKIIVRVPTATFSTRGTVPGVH